MGSMGQLARYRSGDIDSFLKDIDRYSIGLDRMFNHLGSLNQDVNYPPYNLVKLDENTFSLELALAGFKEDEVKVYTEQSQLVVEAAKTDADKREYVHRGLAARSFTRTWTLSEDVEVKEVKFEHGVLSVSLVRIIPENHKRFLWFGKDDQ
jgi:molecular chaperone IbpA